MKISEFQKQIEDIYFKKDSQRGIEGTFMWFAEEIGELTRAIRRDDDRENLEEEFADVLAWLVTLASMKGISLEDVAKKNTHKVVRIVMRYLARVPKLYL